MPDDVTTYALRGTVTLTNTCSGSADDLSEQIRVIAELHFAGDDAPTSWRGEEVVDAKRAGEDTRTATYEFTTTTDVEASHWTIEDVYDGTEYLSPCELIDCPADDPLCRDRAQKVRKIAIVNPNTTHDVTVECACQ